jgi:hypothetical protein
MSLPIWKAGEHMAISGMTGSGKSVLMSLLLTETRNHYLVLKSKADKVEYPGSHLITKARELKNSKYNKMVLRPKFEAQRDEFQEAFELVWKQGGWTVAVDELYYLDAELKLRVPINRLLTQGREPGKISVCTGMQRPTAVTRFAIGEATHCISFAVEGRDAKILQDATSKAFAEVTTALPRHHFAWYYVPERSIWVGTVDMKTGYLVGRNV